MDIATERSLINETTVDAAAVYTLPAGADFLMCYSVAEGKNQCYPREKKCLISSSNSFLKKICFDVSFIGYSCYH